MPDVTVVFSTHNGAGVLPAVLGAYEKQQSYCSWEIIIVNNASTDSTASCLNDFSGKLPLVVLEHSDPGKNRALNSALPKVRGDFVIVTDDDAVPEDNFIDNWLNVSLENPSYDLFGGVIEPLFQVSPPDWMIESRFHFEEIFAECIRAEGPVKAKDIFGPNMAVRASIFKEGIRFNEDIGPNGGNKSYPMGSETEFCTRVEAAGHKAYFSLSPKVKHIVRPNQVRKDFWTSRAYRHGLGVGLQERVASGQMSRPLGKRLVSFARGKLKQAVNCEPFSSLDNLRSNERLWQYHWWRGYTDAKTRSKI